NHICKFRSAAAAVFIFKTPEITAHVIAHHKVLKETSFPSGKPEFFMRENQFSGHFKLKRYGPFQPHKLSNSAPELAERVVRESVIPSIPGCAFHSIIT